MIGRSSRKSSVQSRPASRSRRTLPARVGNSTMTLQTPAELTYLYALFAVAPTSVSARVAMTARVAMLRQKVYETSGSGPRWNRRALTEVGVMRT